jgi:hypothetical protein
MTRPCDCDRTGHCRLCWLYAHNAGYRALWGGRADDATPPASPAPGGRAPAPSSSQPPPESGPGTELAALLKSVGLEACLACRARATLMDRWGVEGCRRRREEIAGWLREAAAGRTWAEAVRAVGLLAAGVNPLDPFGSLVDLACVRAEVKGPAGGWTGTRTRCRVRGASACAAMP